MWRGVDLLRVFVCHLPAAILCRVGDVSCRACVLDAVARGRRRLRFLLPVGIGSGEILLRQRPRSCGSWMGQGTRRGNRGPGRSVPPHVLCKGIGVSGDRGVRLRWTRLSCPGPVRAAGCRHHRSDVRNRRRKRPAPRGRTACPCSGIARPWLR